MGEFKYKFSVITAVYNVEEFLAESIESIVNQTIGIKNIQLILVDDGSKDGSATICDEYAAKYPQNIFVIHKENGGVSSARNMGLDIVQGRYVNFLDADDKLELHALSKAWEFFEANYSKIDILAMPIKFFDAARGDHMLNYKFKNGTRIADLKEEWELIQMSSSSTFIKAESLKNLRFDTTLAYAEDAKVVHTILMEKQALGLLSDAAYLYRKRQQATSAIQMSGQKANWYLPVVNNFHLYIIQKMLERFGSVPKYVQNTLMYDVQWRIKKPDISAEGLSDEDKQLYIEAIKEILKHIDDDVIMAQAHIWGEHKMLALEMKYGREMEFSSQPEPAFSFSNDAVLPLENCRSALEFFSIENGKIILDYSINLYNKNYTDLEFFAIANGKRISIKDYIQIGTSTAIDVEVINKYAFRIELDLKSAYELRVGAALNGVEVIFKGLVFGRFAPLSNKYSNSYYILKGYVAHHSGNTLLISRCGFAKKAKREIKLLLEIFKKDGVLGMGAAVIRILLFIYNFFKIKPIWLISDRPANAGDNGEAFFRYVRENHKNIDARFVLKAGSADYERIKKIGPVLNKDSIKHKLLSAVSQYIVSSHGEPEIFCPLRARVEPFRSLWAKAKFVFLQHGVTKDDLSDWLNKYNKNFTGFVVSATGEYQSVLDYGYFYPEENVWLTGMPRFDNLYNNSKKIISIMPTWRKNLTAGQDPKAGGWNIVNNFEESDFFKFYNTLINHPKIKAAVQQTGYKVEFLLHPNLRNAADLFKKNDFVSVVADNIDYNKLFAESDLIVTDYSSTVFDFVYTYKPVVYTHFDAEEFFGGAHSYQKGYFDYERDGFGEVEYDLDSTVDRLVEYMENGCKLKDKYRERIDSFFAFNDKNNCQRVYEKIVEFSKK